MRVGRHWNRLPGVAVDPPLPGSVQGQDGALSNLVWYIYGLGRFDCCEPKQSVCVVTFSRFNLRYSGKLDAGKVKQSKCFFLSVA